MGNLFFESKYFTLSKKNVCDNTFSVTSELCMATFEKKKRIVPTKTLRAERGIRQTATIYKESLQTSVAAHPGVWEGTTESRRWMGKVLGKFTFLLIGSFFTSIDEDLQKNDRWKLLPGDRFTLEGLPNQTNFQLPLFFLFLGIYVVTIVANLGLTTLISLNSHLHTPMLYFLFNHLYIFANLLFLAQKSWWILW